MQFKRADIDRIYGTSLQGYCEVPYQRLVEVFGPHHHDGDGYKVDAEWVIEFEDGTLATIYNYKDGPNYCGEEGTPVADITDWHIGGTRPFAAELVRVALAVSDA